jgi:hypothetical protein
MKRSIPARRCVPWRMTSIRVVGGMLLYRGRRFRTSRLDRQGAGAAAVYGREVTERGESSWRRSYFFVKLVRAAPASFFSTAAVPRALVAASLSHFFMTLLDAAPCSFFSVALAAQSGLEGSLGVNTCGTQKKTEVVSMGLAAAFSSD